MLRSGDLLLVDSSGQFQRAGGPAESAHLHRGGPLPEIARRWDVQARAARPVELDYLILVPTLRCDLACSYCQVSRVSLDRLDHDWSTETYAAVLQLIAGMTATSVKIEFQGGEPTLRPDLLLGIMDACSRFERADFVICTNLSRLDDEILSIFARPDVQISTSLDGPMALHRSRRTASDDATARFSANLDEVIRRFGPGKVSALPTLDPESPPAPGHLIDAFTSRGLTSIFLRPVNFQGFARKRHAHSRTPSDRWHRYHETFVRELIARNWEDRSRVLEETYFSICLRRIFRPGQDRHVDLRNPNPIGVDYVVVDHDGAVYPTDEARMLTRSGVIDLRIGDVASGWRTEVRDLLEAWSDNRNDPHCQRCAYQPFCGRDVIDDLSRYGRVDMPRGETEFCRRHTALFDLAFDLIHDPAPAVQHSLRRWLGLRGDGVDLSGVL